MVYGASAVDEAIDDATVEWRDVPNGGVSGDDVEVSREQVGGEGGVSPRHRVEQTVVSHHLPLHSTTRVDGREGWQTEKRQSRQEDTMPMHCQWQCQWSLNRAESTHCKIPCPVPSWVSIESWAKTLGLGVEIQQLNILAIFYIFCILMSYVYVK